MADEIEEGEDEPKKSSKLPLIIGVVLALVGGGGGFFAVSSGMILAPADSVASEEAEPEVEALPEISFVPMDPLTVTLIEGGARSFLRFRAQLEVPTKYQPDVELILPRIVDVLNGYLRALRTSDIEAPAALARLRSQMLRRIQIVTGEGRVNDLLIMEFVIN